MAEERKEGRRKEEGGEGPQAVLVRNVKERCTYVVKPGLDRFVRHRRGELFKLYDYLSSPVLLHSLPFQRDESGLSFMPRGLLAV